MVDGEKEGQNPFLTEFSIPPPSLLSFGYDWLRQYGVGTG